jgi:hypothetical protein
MEIYRIPKPKEQTVSETAPAPAPAPVAASAPAPAQEAAPAPVQEAVPQATPEPTNSNVPLINVRKGEAPQQQAQTAPSPQPMDLPIWKEPEKTPEPANTQNQAPAIPDNANHVPEPVKTPAPQQDMQTQTQWSSYVAPSTFVSNQKKEGPAPQTPTPPTRNKEPEPTQEPTQSIPHPEPAPQPQMTAPDKGAEPMNANDPFTGECRGECVAKGFSQQCQSGTPEWHSPRMMQGTKDEAHHAQEIETKETIARLDRDAAARAEQQAQLEHTRKHNSDLQDAQLIEKLKQPQQQVNGQQQGNTQVKERDNSLSSIANMPIWQGDPVEKHHPGQEQTPTAAQPQQAPQPQKNINTTDAPTAGEKKSAPQLEHAPQQPAPYQTEMVERIKSDQDKRWAAQKLRQNAKEDPRLKTLGAIAEHESKDRPRLLQTISHEEIDRKLNTGISSRNHATPQANPGTVPQHSLDSPAASHQPPQQSATVPHSANTAESKRMDVAGLEGLFGIQFDKGATTESVRTPSLTDSQQVAEKRELEPWEKDYQETLKKHAVQQNPTSATNSQQDAYRQAAGQTEQVGRTPAQQAEINRQETLTQEHDSNRNPAHNPATERPYPKSDIDPLHRPQTVPKDFAAQRWAPEKAHAPRSTATRSLFRMVGMNSLANGLDQADMDLAVPDPKTGKKVLPERDDRTRYAMSQALGRHERTTIARSQRTGYRSTSMTTSIQGVEAHYTAKKRIEMEMMWAVRHKHALPAGFDQTTDRQSHRDAAKELSKAATQPVKDLAHAIAHPIQTLFPETAWHLKRWTQAKAQQASAPQGLAQASPSTGYAQSQPNVSDREKVAKAYGAQKSTQQSQTRQQAQNNTQSNSQTQIKRHQNGTIGFIDRATYDPARTTYRIGQNPKDCLVKECIYCCKHANKVKGGSGKIGLEEVPFTKSAERADELDRKGFWVHAPNDRHSMYAGVVQGEILKEKKKGRTR